MFVVYPDSAMGIRFESCGGRQYLRPPHPDPARYTYSHRPPSICLCYPRLHTSTHIHPLLHLMNGTLFCSVISFRVFPAVPDLGIYGRHPVSFPTFIVLRFLPLLSTNFSFLIPSYGRVPNFFFSPCAIRIHST